MHAHTHTHTHARTLTLTRTHTNIHMHTQTHKHTHANMRCHITESYVSTDSEQTGVRPYHYRMICRYQKWWVGALYIMWIGSVRRRLQVKNILFWMFTEFCLTWMTGRLFLQLVILLLLLSPCIVDIPLWHCLIFLMVHAYWWAVLFYYYVCVQVQQLTDISVLYILV